MKTLIIEVNGNETVIEHDKQLSLELLQTLVGGYIELIACTYAGKRPMIVNEEGTLKGLAHNARASELRGGKLVGAALVLVNWNLA